MTAPQPDDEQLRRVALGVYVTRLLDAAIDRGMTIKAIEAATGVGKSTFYRWKRGETIPEVSVLNRFVDALGGDRREAHTAAGWATPDARPGRRDPQPVTTDPDIALIMRKLNDPNTSATEKAWIRRQIRTMADE
jgi:transcriptional regulator with XRE-family HTH domain